MHNHHPPIMNPVGNQPIPTPDSPLSGSDPLTPPPAPRPVPPALFPRSRHALRRRIEADLAQIERCQQGEHMMQATQSPGVVVCTFCRTVGVCPRCSVIPPQGAVIVICPDHRDLVKWQAIALGAETSSRRQEKRTSRKVEPSPTATQQERS